MTAHRVILLGLALGGACSIIAPEIAGAYAAPDAFRCYKIKDTLGKNKYSLDESLLGGVTGLVPQLPIVVENGCEVSVPPKSACFPIYAVPGGADPAPGGVWPSQPQPRPFLCYKMKCDTVTPAIDSVPPVGGLKDDFGLHTLTLKGSAAKSMCVPACALAGQPCWDHTQCCSGTCNSNACL